jgi:hypothetical protein
LVQERLKCPNALTRHLESLQLVRSEPRNLLGRHVQTLSHKAVGKFCNAGDVLTGAGRLNRAPAYKTQLAFPYELLRRGRRRGRRRLRNWFRRAATTTATH